MGTTTEPAAGARQHVFEAAGMGIAPYRFVGVYTIPTPGTPAYENALREGFPQVEAGMGTCAFCGMPIMNVYIIMAADGTRWGVGSECVYKTGDAGLKRKVSEAKRALDAKKRKARGEKAREELQALAEDPRAASFPHSNEYFASQGKTFADELRYYVRNAGASGCVRMRAYARKRLAAGE